MEKNSMSTIAAKMSDAELFSFFSEEKFYRDPELTKAVCQEVENREAALTGRPPAIIIFEKTDDSVNGQSCGGCIILNENSLIKNIKRDPGEVLGTILHEGRHEWQNWIIKHHPECLPESILQMILVDYACYTSFDNIESVIDVGIADQEKQAWIEYSMQEIEIDARFYAIYRMKQIAEKYNLHGIFQESIEKAVDREILYLDILHDNMDAEQYKLLERFKLDKYKEFCIKTPNCPMPPENCICYGNIRMIQNIVYPAFYTISKSLPNEFAALISRQLLYDLYKEARLNMMNGTPLESPEQLIRIILSDNDFKAEYRIKDQDISKELNPKKTIAM